MPLFRRLGFCFAAMGLFAARASGQAFNLRDLLTNFLRAGITLAPPAAPFPSHEAHFIAADSPQFLAVQQLLLRNYGPAIGRQFLDVRIASLEWMKLRDRWHLLHAVGFVLSAIAFTASIGGLCARTS